MYAVKRMDMNKYLTTVSAYGTKEWSFDVQDTAMWQRKSTAENRAKEFNDLDNWCEDIPCKVVEIKFFEKGL